MSIDLRHYLRIALSIWLGQKDIQSQSWIALLHHHHGRSISFKSNAVLFHHLQLLVSTGVALFVQES